MFFGRDGKIGNLLSFLVKDHALEMRETRWKPSEDSNSCSETVNWMLCL